MTELKMEKLLDFLMESDMSFCEKLIDDLNDVELTRFLENNPDFLSSLLEE